MISGLIDLNIKTAKNQIKVILLFENTNYKVDCNDATRIK